MEVYFFNKNICAIDAIMVKFQFTDAVVRGATCLPVSSMTSPHVVPEDILPSVQFYSTVSTNYCQKSQILGQLLIENAD